MDEEEAARVIQKGDKSIVLIFADLISSKLLFQLCRQTGQIRTTKHWISKIANLILVIVSYIISL